MGTALIIYMAPLVPDMTALIIETTRLISIRAPLVIFITPLFSDIAALIIEVAWLISDMAPLISEDPYPPSEDPKAIGKKRGYLK